MSVAIHVGKDSFEIGAPSFLHCFFSTIAVRLEAEDWGTRFPVLMNDLYSGELDYQKAPYAKSELHTIQEQLKAFSPGEVVWDIENRSARPPWGSNISTHITSLSNYFVTSDGKDLFVVMLNALDTSIAKKQRVIIM